MVPLAWPLIVPLPSSVALRAVPSFQVIVTDPGVTPAWVSCRATDGGAMVLDARWK